MKKPKSRTTGDILRDARIALRFSQEDFALHLGVSRRTISRWEFNETLPDSASLPWIAKQIYTFDAAVGEKVARELGVPSPGPNADQVDAALLTAADTLGVSLHRFRAALEPLVGKWRALGCTLDHVAASVGRKGGAEE